ncbi:LOW QUALITY PROTEIN: mastermind-like protein 1 [Menidia menidia]
MGDFVARRHSAVMERLRRRIQLIRQHHSSCSSRYQGASLERLEPERQQTLALHQRCLQTKAKRASKHRPPPPPPATNANATGGAEHRQNAAGNAAEHGGDGGGGGGGGGGEQSRNSTLLALQETVKRKLEAGSPLDHQANGFDGFPQNKKPHLGNGTSNGTPPLEPKPGPEAPPPGGGGEAGPGPGPGPDFHPKEMKQEPEDILPIMPPSGGGASSLFPDLNLNEQEWKELMEELSHSVAMEDIQDILNDGFEDRKDPLELQAPPPGPAQLLAPPPGPAPLLPPVKSEFSPAAFEPDTGSPLLRGPASGSPGGAGSSPGGVASQQGGVASHQRHLLAPPPGPKDLSPAQQLQQLAAQQRVQQFHKMPHKPPQPGAKFPPQGPPHPGPQGPHPPQWGPFGLDKPSYPQDFPPGQKKLLLAPQTKGSPKGPSGYLQGPPGHMLGHAPLGHAPPASASSPMLTYNNTRPLSHFEAPPRGPGPPQARGGAPQDKVALLSLIRQKNSLGFRQQQDQNSYPAPPHGPAPANAMAPGPGNNPMAAQPGPGAMAGNHGNAAYMSSQAAALKQQQYLQRQQLMAEQEKQRQDQQLQRHLTRPPPQYQDQPGPPANQNPFPTQTQFPASSQPMGGVGSMGGPSPGARMFPQNQGGLMGMSLGGGGASGGGVAPPPAASQPDISLPSCGGVAGGDAIYNNMNLQRQPLGAMSPAYRQNLLAQRPNAAMMKQQQLAVAAGNRMPNAMMGAMQGGQNAAWQQQLAAPPPSAANAFGGNANAFHMAPRPKMAAGPAPFGGRPLMMQRAPHNPQTMGQTMANQQPAGQQADMAAFGQQGGARQALPCNQGYQVSRAPPGGGGGQQQVSFGYNVASGSFAAESELVDSLLKGQSTQEWMADLDELLASHQ